MSKSGGSGGLPNGDNQWLNLLQSWSPTIFATVLGLLAADISIMLLRPYMLPQVTDIKSQNRPITKKNDPRSKFQKIARRNVFNPDGVIPPALTKEGEENIEDTEEEAAPVLSQLPISLLGTIVSNNPERSVATIDLKGRNRIKPFQVGDEIEGMAEITEITRRKVIFRNLKNNRRLEYIELKFESSLKFGGGDPVPATPVSKNKEVVTRGENKFEIKRADVLKYTEDLPSLLQQARAVPNRDPRTGEVNGFRILDIKQDSIFSALGVQPMDVIKGVNGEVVNSPKRAMELYQALKNDSTIAISIERGGKTMKLEYSIK